MTGVAINGDEYTPVTVPISSAIAKYLIDVPPRRTRDNSMKMIVSELLSDRTIVEVTA